MSTVANIVSNVPADGGKLIGTHDGAFHCDEVLACTMSRLTDEFANAAIVRTRKPDVLQQCNIVVDVGAVYDEEKLRFDHHQPEFQGTMTTKTGKVYKTRLSSAGLVYKHYGDAVLKKLLPELSDSDINTVHDAVYKGFIEHIDGIDNGVAEYAAPEGSSITLVRNYQVSTSLSSRVGALHPRWNEPS